MNKIKNLTSIVLICSIVGILLLFNILFVLHFGNTTVSLVVLAGQSNMYGFGNPDELEACAGSSVMQELSAGYSNFRYIDTTPGDAEWQEFKLSTNQSGSHQFGPEVGIAYQLHQAYPSTQIYIFKYAAGGATLENNFCEGGNTWEIFIARFHKAIKAIESEHKTPVIKLMCWMQGESDSIENEFQDSYYDNLVAFKSSFIQEFSEYIPNGKLYFVDAAIQKYDFWEASERTAKVNEAKKRFADEHEENYFIDTVIDGIVEPGVVGLTTIYDNLHLDSKSQWKLGNLFGEVLVNILKNQ